MPPPTWRSAAPPAPPPADGPAWRAAAGVPRYRPRWRKFAVAAAGLLAALGGVTWVALWARPPAPARVVILDAGYELNLAVPHNAHGRAAARELAGLARPAEGSWFHPRARLRTPAEPTTLTRGNLATVLADLPGTREPTVVVFVAAHGGRDDGGAYLLPDDATPDPAHRLRVKAVLDRLAALPPRTHKLLVLDATTAPHAVEMGALHNDFAAALELLAPDIEAVPNLVVVGSTGVDQRSWVGPEWGTSAFAHFFLEGLTGVSDPDGDRRLTAWEVFDHARGRTREWARDHRGALQTPVLLPAGEEGERRARAAHLTLAERPGPSAPTAPAVFDPPPELEAAWREYRDLSRAFPPPTAYTPHLWREYEGWVLRYEQLVTAGSPDAAAARAKAAELKRRIDAAARLEVAPQTLALPALASGGPPHEVTRVLRDAVGRAATANDADRPKALDDVRAQTANLGPTAARVAWCRALVEWVALDPPTRLAVVPDVLPTLTDGLPVRPAEVHFLLMLARDLPPPSQWAAVAPLLRRLLDLRTAAERTLAGPSAGGYPFAERTAPWVTARVTAADDLRRPAEDLAFATDEASWAKAADLAVKADAEYRGAADQAAGVARAVRAWHRAAAVLPGLAPWLAAHPKADDVAGRMTRDADLAAARKVWDDAHRLADLCDRPPAGADLTRPLAELAAAATAVETGVASLERRLAGEAETLLTTRPESHVVPATRADAVRWWRAAEAVLTAPPPEPVDPSKRVRLVLDTRRVNRQLSVTAWAHPSALPEPPPAAATEAAFESARRLGLLALSRLGRAGATALIPDGPDGFDQVDFRLTRFAFQADGRASLARAGGWLAEAFAAIPAAVQGRADPTPGPVVWEGVGDADRLARVAPAGAAARLAVNPAERLRRRDVGNLLVGQARRTLADHWYSESPANPYYRLAVSQLLADAESLTAPRPESLHPESIPGADQVRSVAASAEPFPLAPSAPATLVLTDQPRADLAFSFARQDGASGRPGFVVFWVDQPFSDRDGKLPPARAVRGTSPADPVTGISISIPAVADPLPVAPVTQTGTARLNGYYRGRRLAESVAVERHPVPDRVAVRTPEPPTATLALRADPRVQAKFGTASGSVAFVLDCSGSMRADPNRAGDRGRFGLATDTLERLARGLPAGTTVSLWAFGRRTGTAAAAEATIEELLPATPVGRDDRSAVDAAVARAKFGSEPWDLSPVTRTVLRAKASLADAPGPFKAVVLVSDAADNRFADDPANAPKRSIPEVLRSEFADGGVALAVVALPVADKAEAAAQAQWKVATELKPAGLFVPPPKADEVLAWLRRGLNPRVRYRVEPADGGPPFDLAAGDDGADNWYAGRLPPGAYDVRVTAGREVVQRVALRGGDRLLLELTEGDDGVRVTRNFYAAQAPAVARSLTDGPAGWKLSLLQNQALETGGLRMLAAVEDRPRPDATVTAARVGECWFDLTPATPAPARPAVRWGREPGYPSPAWGLDVRGWPKLPGGRGTASPAVEAWWSADGPFPANAVWVPPADSVQARNAPAAVGDTAVTVDSVTTERHTVEVRPGVREPRTCRVVRLTHPAGDPVWARPAGDAPGGSEVRLYSAASKCTCLYWWDGEPPPLGAFELVSLADAKRRAAAAGCHLTLTNVPEPSPGSPRPPPVADAR